VMGAGSQTVAARTAGIARLGDVDRGRLLVGKGDGDVGERLGSGGSHCWMVERVIYGVGFCIKSKSQSQSKTEADSDGCVIWVGVGNVVSYKLVGGDD
jgi:hypothetical protein